MQAGYGVLRNQLCHPNDGREICVQIIQSMQNYIKYIK